MERRAFFVFFKKYGEIVEFLLLIIKYPLKILAFSRGIVVK